MTDISKIPKICDYQFRKEQLTGFYVAAENLHSEEDMIIFSEGAIVYLENGIVGSETHPSLIVFHGDKVEITYYLNNKKHRDGQAAYEFFYAKDVEFNSEFNYENKTLPLLREWYYEGQIHNPDGPATEDFRRFTSKTYEHWLFNCPIDEEVFENHPKRLIAINQRDLDREKKNFKKKIFNL